MTEPTHPSHPSGHHGGGLPPQIMGVDSRLFLGMLAAGVGYALYKRRQNAAAAAASAQQASDTAPADTTGTAPSTLGVTAGITADGSYVTGAPAITTNQQWQIHAETDMIARGYAPLLVDKALGDYLMGNQLPPDEQAVITLVLQVDGPPPEGAPVVNPAPAPTPTPTPVPPAPTPAPPVHVGPGVPWGYAGVNDHPVMGGSTSAPALGGGGTTTVPVHSSGQW